MLSIEMLAEAATRQLGASPKVSPDAETQISTSSPHSPRFEKVRGDVENSKSPRRFSRVDPTHLQRKNTKQVPSEHGASTRLILKGDRFRLNIQCIVKGW